MTTRYGYFLSAEEQDPRELVRQAKMAEEAGFDALWISDHFHPWLDEQGQSGFVWSVIGAISQVTSLPVTTAVTCPTVRIHPAVIAQAAATSALLTEGRFALGVGSGEALNEHILGDRWPPVDERLDMLEEAVAVIREMFTGKLVSHRGRHYAVDTARLYSVPGQPPPVYMSGFGPKAVELAARIADGYICVQPNADFVRQYREAGGKGPAQGGLKACWAADEARARATAHRLWPNEELPGQAAQELPLPLHFAELSPLISEEDISAPCGPDPDAHIKAIRAYTDAGFDEVYISQIGPEQDGFFEFYQAEVLPRLRSA
jgi:G6PDH family F420-dependent oxidoreductase